MVPELYDVASSERSDDEAGALRQVAVDVPRTAPGVAFFHQQRVQKVLERVLFIWGLRCVGDCVCMVLVVHVCWLLMSMDDITSTQHTLHAHHTCMLTITSMRVDHHLHAY